MMKGGMDGWGKDCWGNGCGGAGPYGGGPGDPCSGGMVATGVDPFAGGLCGGGKGPDAWGGGNCSDPWGGGKGGAFDWGCSMGKGGGGKDAWGMPPSWASMGCKGGFDGGWGACGKKGGKGCLPKPQPKPLAAPPVATSPKVFVGALPLHGAEESIRQYFEQFGEIQELKMLYHENGVSKGFCFVTYTDVACAQKVFDNYAANAIDGKWVDCRPAQSGESKGGGGFGKGGDGFFNYGAPPAGGAAAGGKPGDWTCPACGDLVFARRSACNMCGFDRTQAGGMVGFGSNGKGW